LNYGDRKKGKSKKDEGRSPEVGDQRGMREKSRGQISEVRNHRRINFDIRSA